MVFYYFNVKEGYDFSSLKTDGISCSLLFKSNCKHKITSIHEKYLEDLSSYEELLEKKIVAIDPNKGNLMYCFDGKNVLRYTQAQRRHETKKTKYKHIRKKEEGSLMVRLEGETDFMNVQENYDVLSQTNSRSVSSELFKNYIREKNLCSVRFSELFQRDIFRKLRMNTETNTKRSESKFLKRFKSVFGAPEDVVVIFGDWEQRQGMHMVRNLLRERVVVSYYDRQDTLFF